MTSSEMRAHERANIEAALTACAGKVFGPGGAAEILDIKPTTLASRLKRWGLRMRVESAADRDAHGHVGFQDKRTSLGWTTSGGS
jgi:hypothetical protein